MAERRRGIPVPPSPSKDEASRQGMIKLAGRAPLTSGLPEGVLSPPAVCSSWFVLRLRRFRFTIGPRDPSPSRHDAALSKRVSRRRFKPPSRASQGGAYERQSPESRRDGA